MSFWIWLFQKCRKEFLDIGPHLPRWAGLIATDTVNQMPADPSDCQKADFSTSEISEFYEY